VASYCGRGENLDVEGDTPFLNAAEQLKMQEPRFTELEQRSRQAGLKDLVQKLEDETRVKEVIEEMKAEDKRRKERSIFSSSSLSTSTLCPGPTRFREARMSDTFTLNQKDPLPLDKLADEWDRLDKYYMQLAEVAQGAGYDKGSFTGKSIGFSICAAQLRASLAASERDVPK
jgi:hypothetical protein